MMIKLQDHQTGGRMHEDYFRLESHDDGDLRRAVSDWLQELSACGVEPADVELVTNGDRIGFVEVRFLATDEQAKCLGLLNTETVVERGRAIGVLLEAQNQSAHAWSERSSSYRRFDHASHRRFAPSASEVRSNGRPSRDLAD
jgi:hypothetical protein